MAHRSVVLRIVTAIALSIVMLPGLPGAADVRAVGLGPLRVVSMAVGDLHTCAILDTGQVSCWGQGFNGQLGTGAQHRPRHLLGFRRRRTARRRQQARAADADCADHPSR